MHQSLKIIKPKDCHHRKPKKNKPTKYKLIYKKVLWNPKSKFKKEIPLNANWELEVAGYQNGVIESLLSYVTKVTISGDMITLEVEENLNEKKDKIISKILEEIEETSIKFRITTNGNTDIQDMKYFEVCLANVTKSYQINNSVKSIKIDFDLDNITRVR